MLKLVILCFISILIPYETAKLNIIKYFYSETEENGLIPRICQTLFRKMQEEKDESTTFHTEASYLEIYNEKVRDLLQVNLQYSGDLKSRLVRILNGQKEVGLQMVRILNGIWNPEAQQSESGQMAAILLKPFEIPTKLFGF